MRALFLGLVSLVIASALPLSGQASSADPAAAVRAVDEFVNRNGTVTETLDFEDRKFTRHFAIQTIGTCRINVVERFDGLAPMNLTTELHLARLSPDNLEILATDEAAQVHHLRVLTSSGDSTILIRAVGAINVTQVSDGFEFLFQGRSVAEEARQLLGRAIRECGGTPPTPEAQRKIVAARLYRAGNDALTFPLKGMCRDRVARLIGRGTPEFSSDSSFTVVRDPTGFILDIVGGVQVRGERRRFICRFRQEGDTYVPMGPPAVTASRGRS